jgi:hypothetical protein
MMATWLLVNRVAECFSRSEVKKEARAHVPELWLYLQQVHNRKPQHGKH